MSIITQRLNLVPANFALLEAALESDAAFGKALGVQIANAYTEFGEGPLRYVLDLLETQQEAATWWSYFPIHVPSGTMIGTCGFKGQPTAEGMVEIGYEIASDYRNQGLATELAQGLVDYAFSFPEVKIVQAHTLAEENASVRVLQKCGFEKVAEITDPDDGELWQWVLRKA
jgi:ribosomal-protein-alanine N-acetyltransferase